MNLMRPRALVLNEGVLHGDTLSGTSRFGIDVQTDDGSPPPPLHFEYVRSRK